MIKKYLKIIFCVYCIHMPVYFCESCKYETSFSQNYRRHIKTKKHLVNINGGIEKYELLEGKTQKDPEKTQKDPEKTQKDPEKTQEYSCDYCDKKFTLFSNMRRHEIHRCKENPEIIDKIIESKIQTKIQTIKQMEKEKKELKKEFKKQIEILLTKVGNTTNNINNTQNIQLNSYGKEDMEHITDSMKTQLLKIPYGMIPKMIEAVHFNNDKPENKNIAFTNKKENKIKVYSGDKWIYKDKDEIIYDLIDGKYFILDNHYDSVVESLNMTTKTTYDKFRTFFDENDKILHDQLKKECEFVLLNNR